MYLYYSISKGTREPKGSIVWLCAHRINQILLLITVDLNKWDSVFSLICRGMGEQSKFLPKLKVETSPVDTKLCFNPQCTLILMFVICRWLFAFHECGRINLDSTSSLIYLLLWFIIQQKAERLWWSVWRTFQLMLFWPLTMSHFESRRRQEHEGTWGKFMNNRIFLAYVSYYRVLFHLAVFPAASFLLAIDESNY